MTIIDETCVSKYSIEAIKLARKPAQKCAYSSTSSMLNSEQVGEDIVFLKKNGAPKILEQFKDKPYTLELRDEEFTTGAGMSLPTIKKAMH